jgi:hypothetical protein
MDRTENTFPLLLYPLFAAIGADRAEKTPLSSQSIGVC